MFDQITELCVELFHSSVSLISFMDAERQWYLSTCGVDLIEVPRDVAICNYPISTGCSLVVPRLASDERFSNNPLVACEGGIQSYMGCPVRGPNQVIIGTVCVVDQRPDWFAPSQLIVLEGIARIVEDLLELHAKSHQAEQLTHDLAIKKESLKNSNRIFNQAERVARVGSWELEVDSNKLTWSAQVYAIHGLEPDSDIDLSNAINFYEPEDRPAVEKAVSNAMEKSEPFKFEANLRAADGGSVRVRTVGEYLPADDFLPARIVGVIHDISDSYHAQLALKRAADFDSLTNLFNRHAFDRVLQARVRAMKEAPEDLFLLLVDLDGFKDVNDIFGHLVGDVVLEEIGDRISRAVPLDTTVARWGGDEFAIIIRQGASIAEAQQVGEVILAEICKQTEFSGHKIMISGTCGLACADENKSPKELIRRADLALYHGKAREPGRVHIYDKSFELTNDLRHKAIGQVRSALDENRIFPGYQPIVDLRNNQLVGLEALMRLTTRSGHQMTATQVLPAILDPILSREIGERMLSLIAEDFDELRLAQPNLKFISINATEADLISRDFAQKFLKALENNNVRPSLVTLEVTETMLMANDRTTVQKVLQDLKGGGIQIALDDFGTGFSSLSHLRDFPIDKVKIDRSFVASICSNHQDRLIVQALISMALNLNIGVIAEGIEKVEQRKLLLQMGCLQGQGFLFGAAQNGCRTKLLRLGNRLTRLGCEQAA
ncbi:sensor domain-containing phosphodiesterase [Allopontixanthobacter confluentis]|nr:EAL domain-containing protein [Allopontixanthobacter confluentis]